MVLITRRDAINRRLNKSWILGLMILGIVCVILPISIIIVDPLHAYIKYNLRLAKGSVLDEFIQKEIPSNYLTFYLFNITNPERYLSGADRKIRVEEVGPFVFRESHMYNDLNYSDDGTTMTMAPEIRSVFVPEMSVAHPRDINMTVLNLPLLSSATLLAGFGGLVHFPYNMYVSQLKSKAIISLNAEKYLWGYEDPIISLANKLAPGLVYFDSFGLCDRLYDFASKYKIEIGTTYKDKFKIKSVKKYTHQPMGGYERIVESEQIFNETYEGCGYPPDLTPEVPINIYRLGICKTLKLEYEGSKMQDYGGEALVYGIAKETFNNDGSPASKHFPRGVLDMSGCFYNLPFGASKGHFLDADPSLLDQVDGLNPDRNVHVNRIIIDKKEAVTVDTEMSLQLSMVLGDLDFNTETKKFTNSVIPIVHVKVKQIQLPEQIMNNFYMVYSTLPKIMMAVGTASVLVGCALIGYGLRYLHLYWVFRSQCIIYEVTLDKKPPVNGELPLLNESDICR